MRPSLVFADLALSQQLELTEARCNAAVVQARAALSPEAGACYTQLGGAYACFDGVASPLTQTFGLGLFEQPTSQLLADLEQFFRERQAPVLHEVSPLAAPETLALLAQRGYCPLEFTSVLYRSLAADLPVTPAPGLHARPIRPAEIEQWAHTSARAWGTEAEGLEDFMLGFGQVVARATGMHSFWVESEGQPVATAGLFIAGQVALLAGASTVPEARGRGAQRVLLQARLQWAARQGCTLAMMGAQPGSQSQRNAERAGFRVAYTRLKWQGPAS